ncbi:coatomer protein 2 [Iris pallida]|uniref:Coatomer protein 2 n=1 Tax=Iris pallida TaxID=29817 RepID=A0AAX6GGE5_IRIPA|nr:coatomer protein 2 [Iris pallida]KAJ6843241.1 coatomer protein 2 [Iris pallida]
MQYTCVSYSYQYNTILLWWQYRNDLLGWTLGKGILATPCVFLTNVFMCIICAESKSLEHCRTPTELKRLGCTVLHDVDVNDMA